MIQTLNRAKDIVRETQDNMIYVGIAVYLITYEGNKFNVYRVNIPNNKTFQDILNEQINLINEDIYCYHYGEQTRPDISQEVSYIASEDIPQYIELKRHLEGQGVIGVLTRDNIDHLASKSTGYIIEYMYQEGEGEDRQDKSLYAYFKMTKGAFLNRGKQPMFQFDRDNGDNMVEVTSLQLKFDDRLVCIEIEEIMFVFNGSEFERILKYDEHINSAAITTLADIRMGGLISNIDALEQYCQGSKQMKNKLYKIGMLGMVHNITIEDFKGLKRRCGDRLKIEIDDEINQVILQDEHIRESAGHILRVYNNETAETLLDGAFIFADKKVPM